MKRKWQSLCSKCCYILCATFITIILFHLINHRDFHHFIKYKKCEKIIIKEFSDKAKKYIYFEKEKGSEEGINITKLRRWIIEQNNRGRILNQELYGPLTTNTLVFVVQVHHYSCNLNYFLASLSEVEGIQDSLIIFSHAYVDPYINRLLQSIEFCRILQLFYPFSVQAYPDEFPGYDKNDCVKGVNLAEKNNCPSAVTPNGQYIRDPIKAEKKNHWWWTANKVFKDLSHILGKKEMVIFLEHNYYIYRNFIYVAYQMKAVAESLPQCDFLSLCSTLDAEGENAYSLKFMSWHPKYHSNILAIDSSTWSSIDTHYDNFCLTDDYSWSRSLFEVSMNRRSGGLYKVLASTVAKELPSRSAIGDVMDCRVVEDINDIINLQKADKELLFPAYFEIIHEIELYDEIISLDYVELGGGWNDQRDKQLCKNITMSKFKRYFVTDDEKKIWKAIIKS